ncbi:Acetyl esterase/lipase [Fodinibius roseus]|uniref:Acetyl esterase/lipase n=1 Tax=Fodinibius roseus TaxID=1194090 RepID=A0A1M5C2A9_9BACT|nr:alpha/beta hydrolase [Fodinibius roseus]SHF48924.1 Acetyl esterase/lipase [Fodinibius roseus]
MSKKLTKLCIILGSIVAVSGMLPQHEAFAQEKESRIDSLTLSLWPEGAPEAQGDSDLDTPTLTVYLPEKAATSQTGVVIFPGGGYAHLAMDHEGRQVAEWLNSLGIAAFVVKYRLGTRYHHPSQLKDAQRAIRLVRANAGRWNISTSHIGVLGFSAGGHLASTAGTHFEGDYGSTGTAGDPLEEIEPRPDFMILIYPVITMKPDYTHRGSRNHLLGENPDEEMVQFLSNESRVTENTPPAFLVHGSNDRSVPVQNSLQFYEALLKHGVPAEMHLFEDGPHGFGLAPEDEELSQWPDLCERWMKSRGLLSGKQ